MVDQKFRWLRFDLLEVSLMIALNLLSSYVLLLNFLHKEQQSFVQFCEGKLNQIYLVGLFLKQNFTFRFQKYLS